MNKDYLTWRQRQILVEMQKNPTKIYTVERITVFSQPYASYIALVRAGFATIVKVLPEATLFKLSDETS